MTEDDDREKIDAAEGMGAMGRGSPPPSPLSLSVDLSVDAATSGMALASAHA